MAAPDGSTQQISQIGDFILQQQIVPCVELRKHLVDFLRGNRLIGAAIEKNAVLAVRLNLNHGVSLRDLDMLQIAQIDAAAGKQLCKRRAFRAEKSRVIYFCPLRATAMD